MISDGTLKMARDAVALHRLRHPGATRAQPSVIGRGTRSAATWCVRRAVLLLGLLWWSSVAAVPATRAALAQTERVTAYRTEKITDGAIGLRDRFTAYQLAVLEKLNRTDLEHLVRLREFVLPEFWVPDDLDYSVLPARYTSSEPLFKLLVVHLPGQVFGAYESGALVRWGPVSSGRRSSQTPTGPFQLNWRSTGRASTIDPDWFMRWYFNFGNREGLAFHEYALPGEPASHGYVRLLERDAPVVVCVGRNVDAGRQQHASPEARHARVLRRPI